MGVAGAVGPSVTLAVIPPGKSYAPSSSEPDRGSYVEVSRAAAGGGYPLQQGYYGGHTSPPSAGLLWITFNYKWMMMILWHVVWWCLLGVNG
jgi:hypothetical protein